MIAFMKAFIVKTPDGKLFRRNHRHLRKTRETDSSTFEKSVDMDTDSQQHRAMHLTVRTFQMKEMVMKA